MKLFELIETSKREIDKLISPAVIDMMQRHLNPATGLCDCRAHDLAAELGTNRRTVEIVIDKLVKDGHVWHVQRATDAFGKAIVRDGRRVTNGYFPWKSSQVLCSQDCANPPKGLAHWATSLNSECNYITASIGCRVLVSLYLQDNNHWATSPKGNQWAESPKGNHPPEWAIDLQSLSASQRIKTLETDLVRQTKEFGLGDSVTQRTKAELDEAHAYLDDLAKWKQPSLESNDVGPSPIETPTVIPTVIPVEVAIPTPVAKVDISKPPVRPVRVGPMSEAERQKMLDYVVQLREQAASGFYTDAKVAQYFAKADEIEKELGGMQ